MDKNLHDLIIHLVKLQHQALDVLTNESEQQQNAVVLSGTDGVIGESEDGQLDVTATGPKASPELIVGSGSTNKEATTSPTKEAAPTNGATSETPNSSTKSEAGAVNRADQISSSKLHKALQGILNIECPAALMELYEQVRLVVLDATSCGDNYH